MKILVVGNGPTAVDGDGVYHVERYAGELLVDLAALGHAVTFVQPLERLRPDANYYGLILPADKVRMIGVDRRRISVLGAALATLWALVRADFVYIFFPGTLPRLLARLCRLLARPYGLYLRGSEFSRDEDATTMRNARFILCVSESLLDRVRHLNGELGLIRPMVGISAADELRREFAGPAGRPIRLLFVGRLEAEKGVTELLAAAEILRGRGREFELTLIGGGPLHPDLSRRFPRDGAQAIRVCGVIGERAPLMRAYEEADLFVLPTHEEGFPRVLYEAMIKSAVIVTTMVGGIPGLMQDGLNCLAIPVGDPAAIADAIERLADDAPLRRRLAEHGLSTVREVLQSRPPHLQALLAKVRG